MDRRHRIVLDDAADRTLITARTGGWDGELNAAGGRLLARWGEVPPVPAALGPAEARLWDLVREKGWLGSPVRAVTAWPVLTRLQVELLLTCNLTCSYCYSESGPKRSETLTVEQVCRVLDSAERAGVTWVDLTGGEFFLYPGWREVLAHAAGLGLVVTVHTNGLLLTERNVAVLAAHGVRCVQVSADSHRPDVHDGIRGPRGAHARLVRGIRTTLAAGIRTRAVLMAHRGNADHVGAAARWYRQTLGIDVSVDRIIKAGGELTAQLGLTAAEFYERVVPQLGSEQVSRVCESPAATGDVSPLCGVAADFLYVTAQGELALCPTMTSREDPRFAGPHVDDVDLGEAWRTHPFFTAHRDLNCANATGRVCSAASECGGGCRSNAYAESGELAAPDLVACNLHKNAGPVFIDFPARYERGLFGVVR